MSKYLFDDFASVTPKAWKQKIQADLKGADYNEMLLWKTEENITVKPFYTAEDRSCRKIDLPSKGFDICQSIYIDDEKIANQIAVDSLKRGATAIEFVADKVFDVKKVLSGVAVDAVKLYFKLNFIQVAFTKELSKQVNTNNCYFNIDIVGSLAKTGNWFSNLKKDFEGLAAISSNLANTICVNVDVYQNAGATITQQLAYALAHANEYLNYFGEGAAKQIHFNFSVSNNYFFEIAKLRAFRLLWSALLKEYNVEATAHIFTRPSLRNKTLYDYNVNMLRTTSECMSAVLGGSDTVSNIAYDEVFHKSNEFGERIARNQLLILQQESYLIEAHCFANGSYYIESITEQLAENALQIFKLIEKAGGFLKQLKEGVIQKKISESAAKEQEAFNKGTLVLVGTNVLQNEKDKMKGDLELFPFVKTRIEKTLIQPIISKRLAEEIEQKRLKYE